MEQTKDTPHPTIRFSVRRAKDLDEELDLKSAPDGYGQIPIYTYIDRPLWEDPVTPYGCPFAQEANQARWAPENHTYSDTVVFKDYMYLVESLK